MGSAAAVIAQIVPEVKERLPELEDPPHIDDLESARFRLFDSITKFLKSASSSEPMVLILEDLHLADKPSLLLLEFVVREMGSSHLMIVGNYRDMDLNRRHPLAVTLGELTREHLLDRLLHRGLEENDVRRFIEVAAGIDPPKSLVEVVHTQTEGNPLFVSETVRLLIQEGDITFGEEPKSKTASWNIRIPEGVREVIGRRLDRLSDQCNEILVIAGVMGRQFRFGVLLKLVEDVTENTLLDVLDEALDANIVEEEPSEVGLYQFTHALMQETLTSELSAIRTVRLHARIAVALEDFWGDRADEHAVELVEHFAEAETVLGGAKATHYSIVAGERALEAAAPETTLGHFERAHTARGNKKVNAEGARILWGLGRARTATLTSREHQYALDALAAAFDYYAGTGDTVSAVKIAVEPVAAADVVGLADLFDRALDLISSDSFEAGEVMYRLGTAVWFENGDEERFTETMARSLELARKFHDPVLEMRILSNRANIAGLQNQYSECIDLARQVVELAAAASDPIAEANAGWQFSISYVHLGEPSHAERQLVLGTQAAERTGYLGMLQAFIYVRQSLALFLGHWNRISELAISDAARNMRNWSGVVVDAQTGKRMIDNKDDQILALGRTPGHEGLHFMLSAATIASIDPDDARWAELPNLVRTWRGLIEHPETLHSVRARGRPWGRFGNRPARRGLRAR
jgi:hypothetical protein